MSQQPDSNSLQLSPRSASDSASEEAPISQSVPRAPGGGASVQAIDSGAKAPARRATAEMMASRQREISVSEFFTKNRHLLGFDNPAKSLLTAIKEAVDNSLDACEEAGILPSIDVEVSEVAEGRYRVAVQDNGPGIVRAQVPKIFAKLLYGSKFHRLKQSRGQQGIGISAAGLYAQLTTGKPIVIISKTGPGRANCRRIELRIDTRRNGPEVLSDIEYPWEIEHGTRVELELSGTYRGGRTSIDAYLEQTAIANPHLRLTYKLPKAAEPVVFERASDELPREAQEIRPHPHGVELGLLIRMMHEAGSESVKRTLVINFSRVSLSIAEQVCELAGINPMAPASKLSGDQIEAMHKALGTVKVLAPPATCVVPIGEELVIAGLKRRFDAEFYTAVTRPPAVYRGNPFVVECGLAYGGKLATDEPAEVMRFANRVPLQYQPKACATTEAVYQTNWKSYALSQPKGSLPIGPLVVFLHLASVWVPFTSEAKEAVAHYPELLKEMRLAIQEAGRRLSTHLRARARVENQLKRRSLFERYIPEVGASLGRITGTAADQVTELLFCALPTFVHLGQPEEAEADEEPGAEEATSEEASAESEALAQVESDPDEQEPKETKKRGRKPAAAAEPEAEADSEEPEPEDEPKAAPNKPVKAPKAPKRGSDKARPNVTG